MMEIQWCCEDRFIVGNVGGGDSVLIGKSSGQQMLEKKKKERK